MNAPTPYFIQCRYRLKSILAAAVMPLLVAGVAFFSASCITAGRAPAAKIWPQQTPPQRMLEETGALPADDSSPTLQQYYRSWEELSAQHHQKAPTQPLPAARFDEAAYRLNNAMLLRVLAETPQEKRSAIEKLALYQHQDGEAARLCRIADQVRHGDKAAIAQMLEATATLERFRQHFPALCPPGSPVHYLLTLLTPWRDLLQQNNSTVAGILPTIWELSSSPEKPATAKPKTPMRFSESTPALPQGAPEADSAGRLWLHCQFAINGDVDKLVLRLILPPLPPSAKILFDGKEVPADGAIIGAPRAIALAPYLQGKAGNHHLAIGVPAAEAGRAMLPPVITRSDTK